MDKIISEIDNYFNPDSPVEDSNKLVGRDEDIKALKIALFSKGRQAMISGPRGIGKTSLINIVTNELKKNKGYNVVTHKCSEYDTFDTLIYDLVRDTYLNDDPTQESSTIDEFGGKVSLKILEGGTNSKSEKREIVKKVISKQITPNSIAKYFRDKKILFVIDEFDRIKDNKIKTKIAETLRYFADENSVSNIIIAGINLRFDDFFDQHLSNMRSTTVLKLTKINALSLRKVINDGESALGINFTDDLKNLIIWISNGTPYYVHFLCKELCIEALISNSKKLKVEDLFKLMLRLTKVGVFHLAEDAFQLALSKYSGNQNDPFLMHFKDVFPVDMRPEDYVRIRKSLIYALALLSDENVKAPNDILKVFNNIYKSNKSYKLDKHDILNLFRFINEDSDIVSVENDCIAFKDAFHKSYIRLVAFKEYSELQEIEIATILPDEKKRLTNLSLGEFPQ